MQWEQARSWHWPAYLDDPDKKEEGKGEGQGQDGSGGRCHCDRGSPSPSHKQAYVEPDVVLLDHFVMFNLIEQYEELQCWHWQ